VFRGLNLGCGNHLLPSDSRTTWVNLDRFPREGVQVAHNLEETPLPFPDNTFDIVLAFHVLEHIQNLLPLVQEIHRILKAGGTLAVRVPHFQCQAAVADPTHVRLFAPMTFFHFTDYPLGFDSGGIKGLFRLVWLEVVCHSRPALDGGVPGSYFTEIHADLEAVKEDA